MKGCRALTPDEVARVSQAFRGTYAARDRALFLLGVKTGYHISELPSLRVGDVWQHKEVCRARGDRPQIHERET